MFSKSKEQPEIIPAPQASVKAPRAARSNVPSIISGDLTVKGMLVSSGDVQIEGSSGESLVDARVYGFSTNADKAARNQEGVQYNINLENRVLSLDASTNYANAGVDYLVASPTTVDLALDLQNGDATLSDLTGTMVVLANEIDAENLQGKVDFTSYDGDINVEVDPTGPVRIQTGGNVRLIVPWGKQYNVSIWGNPESDLVVDDLGFGMVQTGPGFFAGVVGNGSLPVEIQAGGNVYVEMRW